jgi:hypothetical protein
VRLPKVLYPLVEQVNPNGKLARTVDRDLPLVNTYGYDGFGGCRAGCPW